MQANRPAGPHRGETPADRTGPDELRACSSERLPAPRHHLDRNLLAEPVELGSIGIAPDIATTKTATEKDRLQSVERVHNQRLAEVGLTR